MKIELKNELAFILKPGIKAGHLEPKGSGSYVFRTDGGIK